MGSYTSVVFCVASVRNEELFMKILSETPLINFLLDDYNSVTYAHGGKGKFTQINISYAPFADVFMSKAAFCRCFVRFI
jgi:hypothetical protein